VCRFKGWNQAALSSAIGQAGFNSCTAPHRGGAERAGGLDVVVGRVRRPRCSGTSCIFVKDTLKPGFHNLYRGPK
jgi:hypothetical protein